jgi:hypothetical protein
MAKPVFGSEHLRKIGAEPRIIVRVFFLGQSFNFADRKGPFQLPGIAFDPRVLDVGSINTEWSAGDIGVGSNVSISLDDSDNFLQNLSKTRQFEGAQCEVSHVFVPDDGSPSIPVLLMRGVISSPVSWDESNRTFNFEVVSQLKSTAIGYAPQEEDEIEDLDPDAVGKPWPVCFGEPEHVPAQVIKKPPVTFLIEDTEHKLVSPKDITDLDFRVDDATRFPQGEELRIKIGDVVVRGQFLAPDEGVEQHTFRVTANAFSYRRNNNVFRNSRRVKSQTQNGGLRVDEVIQHTGWNVDHFSGILPLNPDNFIAQEDELASPTALFVNADVGRKTLGLIVYTTKPGSSEVLSWAFVTNIVETKDPDAVRLDLNKAITPFPNSSTRVNFCGRVRLGWVLDVGKPWIHPKGTPVTLFEPEDPTLNEVKLVANALPSDAINQVFVKIDAKDKNSQEAITSLAVVPSNLYTVDLAEDLGTRWPGPDTPMLVTTISFDAPDEITDLLGEEFDNEIFVNVDSVVGRNAADQIFFLLDTFAGLSTDGGSFGNSSEKLNTTPADFARFGIEDVLDLANEIAWQARCVMIDRRGEILLRYLPESNLGELAPTVLNENTIEENTIEVVNTEVSDIITQYQGVFKPRYSDEEDSSVTLLRNVSNFGVIEEVRNMFIYQDSASVIASLQFWLQLKSQIWKTVNLNAFLDAMSIDALDYVNLIVPDLLPAGFVRVNRLSFNPLGDSLNVNLLTPYAVGSVTEDTQVFVDTADELPNFVEEEAEEEPPPPRTRVRKSQNHDIKAGSEQTANSETAYIVPGLVVDDEPDDDTGTYGVLLFKQGENADMDDDAKSTYALDSNRIREFPVKVIGPMRPRKGEHIMVWVTPVGMFYYQPVPRWL